MNPKDGMSAKKITQSIVIAGIIIIVTVGGSFQLANMKGVFKTEVWIDGSAPGTEAEYCYLYVDGVERATFAFRDDYYSNLEYLNDKFEFYNIDVQANVEHEFQVLTSEGDESQVITGFTPFRESTRLTITIFREKTPVTIRGNYTGNNSNPSVSLYVDDALIDTEQGSTPEHFEYLFMARVYQNQSHIFKVSAVSYNIDGALINQTMMFIGSDPVTINLDLIDSEIPNEAKKININILGNYTGINGSFQVDCFVDDAYADSEYVISPEYTDYSFHLRVNESQYHTFKLELKDAAHQFLAHEQLNMPVGTESLTIYMNLRGPDTVTVTIKGNYTGNLTECQIYLYTDAGTFVEDIINPGHTNYSFEFEVYTCVYHTFYFQVRDYDFNYICGYTDYPYIGNEPVTFYVNLGENNY